MRLLRSSCSLFLALVLCFGLCSVTSYAHDAEYYYPAVDYTPAEQRSDYDETAVLEGGTSFFNITSGTTMTLLHYIYQWDGTAYVKANSQSAGYNYGGATLTANWSTGLNFTNNADGLVRDYVVFHANDNVMFYKGETVNFKLTNVRVAHTDYDGNIGGLLNTGVMKNVQIRADTVDGEYYFIDDAVVKRTFSNASNNQCINFDVSIPYLEHDVKRISIIFDTAVCSDYVYSSTRANRQYGFLGTTLTIEQAEGEAPAGDNGLDAEEERGFFGSIIEWLQSIKSGITGVFDKLTEGFANVVDTLVSLPTEIANFLADKLKSLFIPSADSMTGIKDDFDALMGDRFGAIYQAGSMITDWAGNFTEQAAKDTVQMPSVTVDLAGTDFTFGGYDVELVPDRFDFLVDILRGVIDVVCTLAFVNAMKKKYDQIVGGAGA